jgi:hypothetical protein
MTDTEHIANEVYDRSAEEYEDPMAPAIGILNGLILGVIFWVGLALVFCPWVCK